VRVLWLAPYPVWPPTNGGRLRTFNLARRVAASGHQVEMWCISAEEPSEPDIAPPNLSFRFWRQRPRASVQNKTASAMSALPTTAWVLRTPQVVDAIGRLSGFDIAVVGQAYCGGLVPELERAGIRWVLDEHNLEWWLTLQISRQVKSPMTRSRLLVDSMKYRRLEQRLIERAPAVVAVSAQDAERMKAMSKRTAPIDICPNGVDTEYFGFVDHSKPKAANLLMTGTLGYFPNLDASKWFVDEILPKVRATVPNANLTLVGGGLTPEVSALDRPEAGVRVTGQVPDVRPYLEAADVFVMPIRIGSGTRLKALEALASGVPIVATMTAVEGLGLVKRGLCVVGNTANEFAAGVVKALEDTPLRARLVEEGRRYAVECFDWDSIAADFEAILIRTIR
jgi:glycosyltransferase involved in cell wall biosynthesis